MTDALHEFLADLRDLEDDDDGESISDAESRDGDAEEDTYQREMEADSPADNAEILKDDSVGSPREAGQVGAADLQKAAAAGKSFGTKFETEEDMRTALSKIDFSQISDISHVAILKVSLDQFLEKVKKCIEKPQSEAANRNFDDSIEAVLLRAANEKSRAIDDEVFLVSRYIRDNYSPRFPGLEKLIPNYVDYAKAVHFLGNDPVAKLRQSRQGTGRSGDSLDGVLDRPTLMTVEMSLVQHDGRELRPNEFNRVQKACSLLIDLDEARRILANFVQSRMALFAPNMTALLDHNTAAKIITTAGGLTKLTKFPASNLPSMGAKNSIIGMSTNVSVRKEGFVYFSPFIQDLNLDTDIKKKAIRILSAKIVLAARCDAARVSLDGAEGKKFRLQAETTIQKLLKPPKHKGHRALPKPDDKTSKKRGGRQARRVKAATDQTQMSKLADRLNFNQAEEEVLIDGEFQGLGMLGQGQDGQIRSVKIDARTRAKVSKKNNNWLNGAATQAGSATSLQNELRGGTQAGSATSLRAFGLRTSGVGNDGSATAAGGSTTSITFGKGRQQGVVLADPGLADDERKRKMTDEKWFSASTYAPVDADGFKKPLLPALKRVKKQK